MRIAQVATGNGPVRKDQTGSVEALVWLLARELGGLGHEVTVFGCAGSDASGGKVVITHPGSYGEPGTPADWQLCDMMSLCRAIEMSRDFDVIHCHNYLWGLLVERFAACPLVHTMHTCPYEDESLLWECFPKTHITAVSSSQWRGVSSRTPLVVVHHGIDPAEFTFRELPDDYLCFLGRFIPGKGPLAAIRVAKELGMPLVMAGPSTEYFDAEVRPLVDGSLIRWIGQVDSRGRDALLGGARAFLYPLRDPEPFGLVQVEAMMCGTPVVAPAIGATPEIIDDGLTGRLVRTVDEMAAAAIQAIALPRQGIRERAVERFSAKAMAARYVDAYQAAMSRRC